MRQFLPNEEARSKYTFWRRTKKDPPRIEAEPVGTGIARKVNVEGIGAGSREERRSAFFTGEYSALDHDPISRYGVRSSQATGCAGKIGEFHHIGGRIYRVRRMQRRRRWQRSGSAEKDAISNQENRNIVREPSSFPCSAP